MYIRVERTGTTFISIKDQSHKGKQVPQVRQTGSLHTLSTGVSTWLGCPALSKNISEK